MVGLLVLGSCGGKVDPTEDFSDLAGLDLKSDAFSYRLKLLGDALDGAKVKYTRTPRFRGWSFQAAEGSGLDAWVRSKVGDPVAWLLDESFAVVAKSDDADDSTYDSHLVATIPSTGTYYIVFRDYDLATHYFTLGFSLLKGKQKPVPTDQPGVLPDSPLRQAFLAEWNVATWQSHVAVKNSELPAAAFDRADQFYSWAGRPTKTWKLPGGWAQITDWDDNRYFVDLYDTDGTWVDHGYDDYHGGTEWSWSYNDNDPTLCSCSLIGVYEDGHICVWPDGATGGATSFDCD